MTKHYCVAETGQGSRPFFIFEVKIDQRDVRSGLYRSDFGIFEGDWLDDPALDWTRDMVCRLDSMTLEEIRPREGAELPPFLDEKINRYFVRHYRTPLYRNYLLDLYSLAYESRKDFMARCEELLVHERNQAFLKDKEIFVHRFLGLEQRQLRLLEREEVGYSIHQWRSTQIQETFSQVRDALNRCALNDGLNREFFQDLHWTAQLPPDGQERLQDLWQQFAQRYNRIREEFEERASAIESYEAPLSHSQIEIVSRGILWK